MQNPIISLRAASSSLAVMITVVVPSISKVLRSPNSSGVCSSSLGTTAVILYIALIISDSEFSEVYRLAVQDGIPDVAKGSVLELLPFGEPIIIVTLQIDDSFIAFIGIPERAKYQTSHEGSPISKVTL